MNAENSGRRTERGSHDTFAVISVALAALAVVAVIVMLASDSRSGVAEPAPAAVGIDLSDAPDADPTIDIQTLLAEAAEAMGSVNSVEFSVERGGAPIYIDTFESIQVDALVGQFVVPGQAQATIDVTVDGSLTTRIGAVALGGEIWISNPVTGQFETLPAGYDIDPSRFFDPENGWRPLIENLQDAELVGVEDRGGERYHVSGTARAEDVSNITAGLISGQSVRVDLWFVPGVPYLTDAEFSTGSDGEVTTWKLGLDKYDAPFTIEPPPGIERTAPTTVAP